jgi:hypothetical protein
LKEQVTEYTINDKKNSVVIPKGQMYIKVRIMTAKDSENQYIIHKKTKVQNYPLSAVIDPPSWAEYNLNSYILYTEQSVIVN